MPLPQDWQKLKEISDLKREAERQKSLRVEAEALARQETAQQWAIRAQATQFLKSKGYTSGGKKAAKSPISLIADHEAGEHKTWKRRCPLCADEQHEAEMVAGWDPTP